MFYRFITANWKAFIFTFLVLYASLSNMNSMDTAGFFSFPHADKLVHFLMFLVLTLSWLSGISKYYRHHRKKVLLYPVGISIFIFGVLMELLQHYISSGRTAELTDILANTLGIIAAFILFRWLKEQQWIYQFL